MDALQAANRRWLGDRYDAPRGAYLMGDTPALMMAYRDDVQNIPIRDQLETLIAGNVDHPSRELMWGAPGTMLAALFLYERTQEERWAHWFRVSANKLWSQLLWSEEYACHYWTQDLYGSQSTYLDAVHGFVATAVPLIRGRALLAESQWREWLHCIINTVSRTATWHEGQVNWRALLLVPAGGKARFLMQFCHGAPGFVTCLGDLPGDALDALLLAAGETIWAAGPLAKGSNLCHGTGGNGYAFLKLYRRTGDIKWLARARAFAMHGIAQTQVDRHQYGQGRYSLWTGDVGFAVYLWHCLRETAAFPTLDVF
jgi:peptidoglycan/LPS O-acetylase OafA/YrhL